MHHEGVLNETGKILINEISLQLFHAQPIRNDDLPRRLYDATN